MNWTLKDISQFRPLKIVFAIWKTLMNLCAKDIRCTKEIKWFKPRMNQFVLQAERIFQTAHTTDSQSHSSTLCRSNSHSFKSNITLRNESHKVTNLIKSKEEQNYKILVWNT